MKLETLKKIKRNLLDVFASIALTMSTSVYLIEELNDYSTLLIILSFLMVHAFIFIDTKLIEKIEKMELIEMINSYFKDIDYDKENK